MNDYIISKLKNAGIRPSSVRIHILKYLEDKRDHPSADRIYNEVLKDLPGLSRASVYNTLAILENNGLIHSLNIEPLENHYDADNSNHGHIKCEKCKLIFDIELPDIEFKGIEKFKISKQEVFLWGICPKCSGNID